MHLFQASTLTGLFLHFIWVILAFRNSHRIVEPRNSSKKMHSGLATIQSCSLATALVIPGLTVEQKKTQTKAWRRLNLALPPTLTASAQQGEQSHTKRPTQAWRRQFRPAPFTFQFGPGQTITLIVAFVVGIWVSECGCIVAGRKELADRDFLLPASEFTTD
ncbi:hypothetical protein C8F01DRAFT_1126834 [Mycena amicta]|nr:hypothetical protein C8F01DRAFT_1126834 [Mycena amicta]